MDAHRKSPPDYGILEGSRAPALRFEPSLWAWIPVPLFLLAILFSYALQLPMPRPAPLYVAFTLSFLFLTPSTLLASILFARNFRSFGPVGSLFLSCGMLSLSLGCAAPFILVVGGVSDANLLITVQCIGVWTGSLLCLAGAANLLRWNTPVVARTAWLFGVQMLAVIWALVVVIAAANGWTPVLYAELGSETLHDSALLSAVMMFLITARMMQRTSGPSCPAFIKWLVPALVLMAVGYAGLVFNTPGHPLPGWIGRGARYLGGIYIVAGAVLSWRNKDIALHNLAKPGADELYPYAIAFAAVLFATVFRMLFLHAIGSHAVFITFFPAVMLVALYGGLGAGLLATAASTLSAMYFWIEPTDSFFVEQPADRLALGLFVVVGAMISWISNRLRAADTTLWKLEASKREEMERLVASRTAELMTEVTIRRNAETALIAALDEANRNKSELETILDVVPAGVCIARDRHCNFIGANRAAYEMFRLKRGSNCSFLQKSGGPLCSVVDEQLEAMPGPMLPMQRAARGESVVGSEFGLLYEDGSLLKCYCNAEPLRDAEGNVIGSVIAFLDITRVKEVEDALKAALNEAQRHKNELATIFELAPVALGITRDLYCRVVLGNKANDDLLGIPHGMNSSFLQPNKLPCRAVNDALEEIPGDLMPIERALKGESVRDYEISLLFDDGSLRRCYGYAEPLRNERGRITGAVSALLDITRLKQVERELRKSEARFRAAQESSLDAFVIYEPVWGPNDDVVNLRVVFANQKAAEYSKTLREELVGKLITETLMGFDDAKGVIDQHARVIRSGRPQEYVLESSGGAAKRFFRNTVVPFGEYVATTFRDVTSMMEATKALAVAKAKADSANLSKSKFLAAASHDLRQPVQSLALLMPALERHLARNAKAARTMDMMKNAVESLSGLLSGILDLSRLDADLVVPEMGGVDIGKIIEKLVGEYTPAAMNKGVMLRAYVRELRAWTDARLLERVLRNLIENAMRYTKTGGILVGMRRRGKRIVVEVVDTGIGIPFDKQAEIFEEFYQLNNPDKDSGLGLGLGLSIVARLVRLIGGEVRVVSQVGRGSRFIVEVPFDNSAHTANEEGACDTADPGGRILIVEDNPTLRQGFELILEAWNYDVIATASGEEALDIGVREDWKFDAIITDHRLGSGLSGTAMAKEFERRAGRPVPTLILTGDTSIDQITEIHTSGFVVLHKPVKAEDLRCNLALMLEHRPHPETEGDQRTKQADD